MVASSVVFSSAGVVVSTGIVVSPVVVGFLVIGGSHFDMKYK